MRKFALKRDTMLFNHYNLESRFSPHYCLDYKTEADRRQMQPGLEPDRAPESSLPQLFTTHRTGARVGIGVWPWISGGKDMVGGEGSSHRGLRAKARK